MGALSEKLEKIRFYGILDTGYVARESLFKKCRELIDSGIRIIQLRAKSESPAERKEIALEIFPLFQKNESPILIINDDAELAASLPSAGLHVGQDDISPQKAREIIGSDRILGLSTHSRKQAEEAASMAQTIDYFAVGPVYPTATKKGRPAVGLGLVEWVAKELKPPLPWFAIGGINMKTAQYVRKAGAERIVAVSEVLRAKDSGAAAKSLENIFWNNA